MSQLWLFIMYLLGHGLLHNMTIMLGDRNEGRSAYNEHLGNEERGLLRLTDHPCSTPVRLTCRYHDNKSHVLASPRYDVIKHSPNSHMDCQYNKV